MEIVKRVKKALNRRLPLAKAKRIIQGDKSQKAKPAQKRATTMAKKKTVKKSGGDTAAHEIVQLPRNDTEILDQLIEGPDELVGVYDKIHEALSDDEARAEFVSDFEIEPIAALDNANNNLTMKVIQVRAQRMLIEQPGPSQESGEGSRDRMH